MRRRAGNMRRTVCGKPCKKLTDRLLAVRKHQRCPPEHRTQEDLQPAITTNVIKGRPSDRGFPGAARFDRGRQTRQAVHHRLRRAGRSGGEKNPFGSIGT